MAKDNWFDTLARESAQGLSRRQVFGRLFGGVGVAVLGTLGLRQFAQNDCARVCEECCHTAFPDHGPGFGQCVSDCRHGEGLCGPVFAICQGQ